MNKVSRSLLTPHTQTKKLQIGAAEFTYQQPSLLEYIGIILLLPITLITLLIEAVIKERLR